MSQPKKAAQVSAAPVAAKLKYANMSPPQKLAFIGKTLVFLLTFGFAYPNIFME